jgi:hypothetical protein
VACPSFIVFADACFSYDIPCNLARRSKLTFLRSPRTEMLNGVGMKTGQRGEWSVRHFCSLKPSKNVGKQYAVNRG